MKNWGGYIFSYFDFKYTNAFTESMNRKVMDIHQNSRGCNFETLKARILYGTYLMKRRDDDREAELRDLIPGFGIGRRPAPAAKRAYREGQEERLRQYELPGTSSWPSILTTE